MALPTGHWRSLFVEAATISGVPVDVLQWVRLPSEHKPRLPRYAGSATMDVT